jgi:hypothetical protein
VLTGEEFATGFFTHCSGAGGAIGLVCRHLGEEASVVLLLLVVVAELPFTLCRHPTLRLHHLLYFIRTTLVTLRGVETLHIAGLVHARALEFADRVVSLRAATHARV